MLESKSSKIILKALGLYSYMMLSGIISKIIFSEWKIPAFIIYVLPDRVSKKTLSERKEREIEF